MQISFVEPHLEVYGGIRRVLEFSNRFVARGHAVTIYHPSGQKCTWMRSDAEVRPSSEFGKTEHEIVIFNDPPDYRRVHGSRARLKVFYVLDLDKHEKLTRFDPRIWWPRKGRILSLKRALQMPFVKVVNATWMQQWLHDNLGVNTRLQLGGVNRDVFHPVEAPRDPSVFSVLCSGDPRERKGTDTVMEATARVRERHRNVVVQTYHRKGIPQSAMALCYSQADLFVDGQWYAGWNNPVIEAMACGVPVVCTEIGGVQDFAWHERTALLVPPRDPGRMAEAIARMIEAPVLRRRLAAAALEVAGRFDWEAATGQFLALLETELIRQRTGRRA